MRQNKTIWDRFTRQGRSSLEVCERTIELHNQGFRAYTTPAKFLQFCWVIAIVFQPNLKCIKVKIKVSMVTKITKSRRRANYKYGGKISRF